MFLRPVVQPVVWPAHSHPRGPVGGGGAAPNSLKIDAAPILVDGAAIVIS
jgi:hypothetical protein